MLGQSIKRIAPGDQSIRQMAPPGPVMCRYADGWRLRETWDVVPAAGEVVEFVTVAEGREEFRTLLAVAAIVAAVIPAGQAFAPYLAAASVAYNLLVPPTTPDLGDAAKSVFSAGVSGNAARLDEPIWRTCGIDRLTPPFAGIPYGEFLDDDGDNVDNEQYLYAICAVGYGPMDLLADYLGKTPVNHYQDILVHKLLQPGEQPSLAKANVYTSTDIGGFELAPKVSVGSYVACPPGKMVEYIGIDIVAVNGLGAVSNDGDVVDVQVKWIVQARTINDAGAPTGPFRTVPGGVEERTMNTNTQQRWSGKYPISPPRRVEVRVVRTNEVDTRSQVRDSITWAGLRGYSSEPAPLNPNVSHYELVIRASKQVSEVNQTSINLIVQAKTRTWNPTDGWSCEIGDWANYVATRNPAWWLADLWSDPNWGEGLPNERIDLLGLYRYAATWANRQDRCDYTFASTTDAWSASQLIARTGRARVFRRYGVRTLKRDELAEMGETAFSARMCRAGTKMTMVEKRPQAQDPDGIVVQYRSNVTWDTAFIECPCPGVVSMVKPIFRSYAGIQGYTHAKREGTYDAYDMGLRQRTVQFETAAQGILATFLAPALWQPQIGGYGQTGDVAFWDAGTRVMGLTEPADFTPGALFITLRKDDGTITAPISVSPGPTAYDVVLATDPGFTITVDDGTRERPVYLLGTLQQAEIVKVGAISPSIGQKGAPYYGIQAVIDDPRVHTADHAFLPGVGGEQDPIRLPGDDVGSTGSLIIVLDDRSDIVGQPVLGGANYWSLTLANDGSATVVYNDSSSTTTVPLVRQWVTTTIEAVDAALFEVQVSIANGFFDYGLSGDSLRTWLGLGTSRTWTLAGVDRQSVAIDVSIRSVDDGSLQATARFTVRLNVADLH